MKQRKKNMEETTSNRVYMAYKYGIRDWYDDEWEYYKSHGRWNLRNWKNYRRTQWKVGTRRQHEDSNRL